MVTEAIHYLTSKKVVSTEGRLNRKRWWVYNLVANGILVIAYVLLLGLVPGLGGFWGRIIWLLMALNSIFTSIKRLHDMDRPTGDIWVWIIPIYNIYVLGIVEGTRGPNQFGEDPLKA